MREADGTVRSVVRNDVAYQAANGYTPVADFQAINTYTNEAPQCSGLLDVDDDFKIFINAAFEINENAELYALATTLSEPLQAASSTEMW